MRPEPWSVWRHWKGDLYLVIAVAQLSNTDAEGAAVVIYRGLRSQPPDGGEPIRVRTLNGVEGWDTPVDALGSPRFVPFEATW